MAQAILGFLTLSLAASIPDHNFNSLAFLLHPEAPELLEQTLHDIADPSSRLYGKHLTQAEADTLSAPGEKSVQAVERWLHDAGLSQKAIVQQGRWLHVRLTAEQEQSIGLRTDQVLGKRRHSVPSDMNEHVALVHRQTHSQPRSYPSSALSPRATQIYAAHSYSELEVDLKKCKDEVTPPCIRKLYNMPKKKTKPAKRSLFGVAGFFEVR